MANHALGKTTSIGEFAYAASVGAVLGPLALLSPVAAVGVAGVGVISSTYLLQRVFSNPDATYVQKAEAVGLVIASIWGARVAGEYYGSAPSKLTYYESVPAPKVPDFPLSMPSPEGVVLESGQVGLVPQKVGQIPGLMQSMLKGEPIPAIGGYRAGNRYIIMEGNHRMTAALELFKQTGDPRYVMQLLLEGRWDAIPPGQESHPMTE